MQTILVDILLLLAGIVLSVIAGTIVPLILPYKSRYFARKPFSCRPCLSFHLICLWSALMAFLTQSLPLFVAGVVSAFIVFLILKKIDNNKIID